MRRIALPLAFGLLSLAFAPAPFPKAERAGRESEQTRLVREYDARLRELGVRWELHAIESRPYVIGLTIGERPPLPDAFIQVQP